ncbi:aminoglycoside phosphotransferase [Amycolatopsis acidicola]|uniref:Aminoglycoside phosphotransferase n=2 Tax=Amycolatopsis acidicola TaxID=2596893 RepID=A0A5N0V173_9PSEU|nr:aminoglycoside phosphotransferase [Amycolatopsis acidicola]
MRDNLAHAANHFGVTVTGDPVLGWALRSISAPAHGPDGRVWLRVLTERTHWLDDPDLAAFWTGNVDANTITGVPKPTVLHWTEWNVPEEQRRVRAELMTFVDGSPCSPTDVLSEPLELPEHWWQQLRHTVNTIATIATQRFARSTPPAGSRIRQIFGDTVADRLSWTPATAHGDLHWNNLLQPELVVLDWELWGQAQHGTDAATLYLYALPAPDTARQVHALFADLLDSPAGHVAQLGVAARILHRAEHGEYPDLAAPVRALADRVIATLPRTGPGEQTRQVRREKRPGQ